MSWPLVVLILGVLLFGLGVHVVGAFERRWRMLNETWAELERDKMAAMVGQSAQQAEVIKGLGLFRPPQEGE